MLTNPQRKTEFPRFATVACQGAEGANSQTAASAIFENPDIMYMRTFDGVFRAVNSGLCRYGILPVENSSAGTVTDVYDLMREYKFYIVRSVKIPVPHALLAKKKIGIERITEIFTHEQAARQCGKFLEQNPHLKLNLYANTAAAARLVAESNRTDIAAIASESCAALYGLYVLAKNIQNYKRNYTRFVCISKECEIYDGADKISLMLSLEHKPGSLYEVIKEFAGLGLNLTKLESRPLADTDFEFMFYFDLQANIESLATASLITRLSQNTKHFLFLGNYEDLPEKAVLTQGKS